MSSDGKFIVGRSVNPTSSSPNHAFRWTQDGMSRLVDNVQPFTLGHASGVSDDGQIVVGIGAGVFKWTQNAGVTYLRSVGSDGDNPIISGDASTIAANSDVWNVSGMHHTLATNSVPRGISRNGATIVGYIWSPFQSPTPYTAFKWTQATGQRNLPPLSRMSASIAFAVANDSSVVGGASYAQLQGGTATATVWDSNNNPSELQTQLTAVGIDLKDWTLQQVTGITVSDGIIHLTGTGAHNGKDEAFVVRNLTIASSPSNQYPQGILQVTEPVIFPPPPTSTPPLTSFPKPESLSTTFVTFYSGIRSSFDAPTQTFLDAEIAKLGQWLNTHKSATTSNVFLKTADAVDVASRTISLALAFVDLRKLSTGGVKALGTEAEQLKVILGYSLSASKEIGVIADTPARVFSITSAVSDAADATFLGGGVPAMLSLNATIWGDFVVPQLRKYGQDPPDPNFTTAANLDRVVFRALPTTGDSRLDTLFLASLQSAYDTGMYMRAVNETLDKYAGALNAGNGAYALRHMVLFIAFLDGYEQKARRAYTDSALLGAYLSSKGFDASSIDFSLLPRVQQQIKQDGLSPAVVNYLNAAGYSPLQMAQLKVSLYAYTPPNITPDVAFLTQTTASSVILTSTQASSRLANLSVRTTAGIDDNTLIAGFAAAGSDQKQLIIRGLGPSLNQFGVGNELKSVVLTLFNSQGTKLTENSNWENALGSAAASNAFFAQVGAFPLQTGSKDAALSVYIFPRTPYSAQVSSTDRTSGIALVEIFDASPTTSTRLVNISARCRVTTGNGLLIAGFVIAGNSAKQLLIRAIGPSLAAFGVSDVLNDPKLQIFQRDTLINQNDDWWRSSNVAELSSVYQSVGAFPLPASSKDSALLLLLPPGNYTAQVTGQAESTGVALVEIYEVQ